jgi:DNA-binding response OmpR family regulator
VPASRTRRRSSTALQPRRRAQAQPRAQPRDVLIVDDEEVVRGLLVWLFEEEGYTVREAASGAQALAELEAQPPSCMILDLMMPEVDGQEVLRQRAERGLAPETRVVVLTAKTARGDEVWCWEHGADEYLNKPFDGERLLKLVKDLMKLTPAQLAHRRDVGLSEARRIDAIETALKAKNAKGR